MTEDEVIALCSGHDFVFKTGKPEITIYMGRNNAILMIRLNPDHTVGLPTHVSFGPDERYWHWDQENQCVIFTDENDKFIVSKYSAPVVEESRYIEMTCLTEPDTRYVAYLTLDMESKVITDTVWSKQFLLLASQGYSQDEQAQINECVTIKQAEVKWLANQNAWQLVNSAWETVVDNSRLRYVCLLFSGELSASDDFFPSKLQLPQDDNKQFLAGPRRDVLQILSQLLIWHNEQIMAGTEQVSPIMMMKEVVTQ
ncbi:hypothetical protein PT281_03910 [Lactobacillus sp. ESL0701]|uniref:hypothetical protein n=1 Tax=Lactobacillus sp. ESL0701 TaxID=2983217 RepID=UPI0023F7466B|nr:hypothetical protein [Lactobacillus sp. ESL0701]MDF7672409.1 hypothetical protein [Lactobacillus sp. ESL0701]